jgi:hypothetical protein
MKNHYHGIFGSLCSLLIFTACGHSAVDKEVDKKIAKETTTQRSELNAEIQNFILNSPNLNSDQRTRLASLRDSTRSQMAAIQKESMQLQSILIRDIFSDDYKAKEVRALKRRIKTNESRRLDLVFKSLDQANYIFGREPADLVGRRLFANEMLGDHMYNE